MSWFSSLSVTHAIGSPVGDQVGAPSHAGSDVTFRGELPSAAAM